MDRRKFVMGLVFVVLIVLSSVLQHRETKQERNETTASEDRMPKFSDITYTRPDMDAITEEYTSLTAALKENSLSMREALPQVRECYQDYDNFYTMQTVAELRYYHDITDAYYAEESEWFLEQETEMDRLFTDLCTASANSNLGEALDEQFWGGWTVDAYRGQEPYELDPTYLDLMQRENDILTEYRRISADPTILWQGAERSFLELQEDDSISLKDWREIQKLYYEKYSPIFAELYLRLVGVRQEQAAYLGLDSYEDYAYSYLFQREYSPEQAESLLTHIRTDLAPLYQELGLQERWANLGYTELNEAENLEAVTTAAKSMGRSILFASRDMTRYELYDIDVSEKKGNLSYQCYLYTYDIPFVFVKTEGYSDDILNFGHEFGHFVDAWYNRDATKSYDLSEVFSQGMEYLLLFYAPEDYREELTEYKLMDTVDTFTQQGSYAEFEHEVYARPAAEWTVEELEALSLRLAEDYGYLDPSMEEYYAKSWFDVVHFFERPFYVVSYCVSNDAAFQIYALECREEGAGLACWNNMLPRDSDSFLETIMDQGGLEDPFAPERMQQIADLIRQKLG
ncbi:MAG: hypothetical protein IIY94_09565 [Oscillospiraceae bacterium]|nr:hypothetical protein [Oscillospiraceae bacterium]